MVQSIVELRNVAPFFDAIRPIHKHRSEIYDDLLLSIKLERILPW